MTAQSTSDFDLPAPRHGAVEFATDMDLRVGSHIKQAEQAMIAAKTESLRPLGLTVAQYAVLMALYYVPGQSSAQLARVAAVTPQTMGTILDKLAQRGLIERKQSNLHRKVLETSLTKHGKDLVLRADQVARAVEERLGQGFSAKEREMLRDLLQRAVVLLRNGEPPAADKAG